MELFRVQLLSRMFELRIVLVFDPELLDQIRGWKLGEAFQSNDRDWSCCLQNRSRLRGISVPLLEIGKGLIVVWSVTWNGHDNTSAIIRFYEASREDRDLVARDRIPDGLPHQLTCRHIAFYNDFLILVLKLLHRLPTDHPQLFVHPGSNVGGFRVNPEVRDPEHCLWPQSRSGIDHAVLLELDQVGLSYLGFHISLGIHGPYWSLVVGTPGNRMCSSRDQSFLVQGSEVPFDVSTVQRVDGRELSTPVDGEPDLHHSLFDIVAKVGSHRLRILQFFLRRRWDSIDLGEGLHDLRVAFAETLGHGEEWRAGVMEPHREESIVAFHPVISRVDISDSVCSRVTDMLGRVRVGISCCHIVLGLTRVRICLVNLAPVPLLLPLSFKCAPVKLGPDC